MSLWKRLLEPDINDFILQNEGRDVADLGLKKPPVKDWPYPLILNQIRARQKSRGKMPSWHAQKGIIFPSPDLVEQASSEAAARYKASLVKGSVFADLTAGTGMDFCMLLENFDRGLAVEKDKTHAEILEHNLRILGRNAFTVYTASAEDIIGSLPSCDLVYLDPQRRSAAAKGKFRLEEGSPDILKLLPVLSKKAACIMLKTSPVLDIHQALTALGCVTSVHIIEWRGECREILYCMNPASALDPDSVPLTAVILDDAGRAQQSLTFSRKDEQSASAAYNLPEKYLYEPSPAFQKSGCHKYLAVQYGLAKLHVHTHLYTSAQSCPGFPGRAFEIIGMHPVRASGLQVRQAHLTLRNFPGTADSLRKKLGLKDGGNDYLFACTLLNEHRALIHGRKLI